MKGKLIVHVAEIEPRLESGMGRVAWHWARALERQGHEFLHIGPAAIGPIAHRSLFPSKAWQTYKKLRRRADLFLVHEASSGPFASRGIPLVVFAHGLERRIWQYQKRRMLPGLAQLTLKQRLLEPLIRLRHCDRGVLLADRLFLIHREDCDFAKTHYGRRAEDIFIFRNGVDHVDVEASTEPDQFTVLFNGSWIRRKGVDVLGEAARRLHDRSLRVRWVLAGTQASADTIWQSWPAELREQTRIVPTFPSRDEVKLLTEATVFALPSVYEGQPLSLLQAMAASRCCITTDCCGQRDVIQHEYNGLLINVGDAATLATLIERCYHDPAGRRAIGTAARASMAGRAWQTVSDEVAGQLLALLGAEAILERPTETLA